MTLASALAGKPAAFVNADVTLDGEPVIGSFTVGGLTFAVIGESSIELVGVSPDWQQVTDSQEGEGSGAAPMLASGSDESASLALPETITYSDTDYTLTSIGAYAFYLSGVTSVTLPASVSDVDARAFRSSDVANVTVADGNPSFSSYDGVLYDASRSSLLLIPGGRQGAVRISSKAEEVDASAFSHCAGVDAISVDAGSAHLSSWEGLLYDADGTTLLRVPAGATDITIREGCTTIAAGALEACASLATITAPASVTSISPDVFTSVPTVSLPAASVLLSGAAEDDSVEEPQPAEAHETGTQLTAMVALSSAKGISLIVDPSTIEIFLPGDASETPWSHVGFSVQRTAGQPEINSQENEAVAGDAAASAEAPIATLQSASTSRAHATLTYRANASFSYSPYTASSTPIATVQKTVGEGGSYSYPYDEQVRWNGYCIEAWARETSAGVTPHPSPYWYLGIGAPNAGVKFATLNDEPMVKNQWYRIPSDGKGVVWMYDQTSPATVTWNANGGSVSPTTSSVQLGKTVNAPFPTRSGQTFTGWYTASSGGTKVCGSAASGGTTPAIRKNVTYYAHWAPIPMADYNVTVRGNEPFTYGGWRQATGTGAVTSSYSYKTPYVKWVQSGAQSYLHMYHDDYWWYNAAFGGLQAGIKNATIDGSPMKPNTWYETTKATEIWIYNCESPTTVTWNANGGSVSPASSSVILGATVSAPLPTQNGYAFKGWYTAATGGTYVCGGATSGGTTGAIRKPTTYYALWNLLKYDIAYNLDGGTLASANPSSYDVTTATFTLANPTKTGYVFTGWSGTGLTGSANKAVSIPKGSTGNRSYVAHWAPALSAIVPLEVEARVDILGVEPQVPAPGYISSRCAEALTVAEISFLPDQQGINGVFGSGVSSGSLAAVFLEVLADGAAAPNARFPLDGSVSRMTPSSPELFVMGSYNDKVDIAYRFAIPTDLLGSLNETTAPLGSVAYTVALQNPPA